MSQVLLDQRSMPRDALTQRALRAARGFDAAGVCEGDAIALLLRDVGRLTPHARTALYGEDGQPVALGAIGEISVRVPTDADFTHHKLSKKRKEVERDGLISCSDISCVKDDHLYLCDRRSDMVISAGVNIDPAETEATLLLCPTVRDCAVFSIPGEHTGESLAAAIGPMPGTTPDAVELRGFLEVCIAKCKVPRRFDLHSALPHEDSGKIFKRRLRDPSWQDVGRRI